MITLSDQVFAILSIFLVVEILSQLFKLEMIGKIFVQFYVIIMHLFILVVLVNYETREFVYYFVSLAAVINSLRYLLYKIPAFKYHGGYRFFLDTFMVSALVVFIYQVGDYFPLDVSIASVDGDLFIYFILSLVLIFFYEVWQRSLGVGLDTRSYLPDTLFSMLIVFFVFVSFISAVLATFLLTEDFYTLIIQWSPAVLASIIVFMLFTTLIRPEAKERYSLLYVLPTFFIFIQFFSIFLV
jgi:hypothetical protein